MDRPDDETNSTAPTSTVAKEPELETIVEGKLLSYSELGQEREPAGGAELGRLVFSEDAGESTPLLRSSETATDLDRSYESSFVSQSQQSASFTNSQASLFIPSIQFSLYSSRGGGHDFSKSALFSSRSAIVSLSDEDGSSPDATKSVTVSLFEKIAEDGQAPSGLALWNVMNMILGGTTVLAMPYAIALGGLAGVVALLLVGLVCDHTALCLVECLYEVSPKTRLRRRVRANYAEVAAAVWGPIGGWLVDFGIVTVSFTTCILSVMALGTNLQDLFQALPHPMSLPLWCLVAAVCLLPIVFVKKLSVLAWISMLGVIALITSVIVLIGFSLEVFNQWTLSNLPPFDMNTFPVSLSMIVYSYCGHGVFTGIEGSMRDRPKFKQVTHSAFSVVTLIKFLVGLCFCLLYGMDTQSIVTINLHASHRPVISTMVSALVIINIFCSFPLNMFVVSGTFDALLMPKFLTCGKGTKYHFIWVAVTRALLVFVTLGVALAVPHFGLLMGVFGSLLGACLSIVFPCLLHMQLKWKHIAWHNVVLESFIVVFGVLAGCLGLVYSSIALSKA